MDDGGRLFGVVILALGLYFVVCALRYPNFFLYRWMTWHVRDLVWALRVWCSHKGRNPEVHVYPQPPLRIISDIAAA